MSVSLPQGHAGRITWHHFCFLHRASLGCWEVEVPQAFETAIFGSTGHATFVCTWIAAEIHRDEYSISSQVQLRLVILDLAPVTQRAWCKSYVQDQTIKMSRYNNRDLSDLSVNLFFWNRRDMYQKKISHIRITHQIETYTRGHGATLESRTW